MRQNPQPTSSGVTPTDAERVFWQKFAEARTVNEFCQSWLPLQCRMIKNVRCGMVLMGVADRGPYAPMAVWPDAKLDLKHLSGVAERALRERRGLLVENRPDTPGAALSPESFHIAYPIEVSDQLHGVVVLGVNAASRREVQGIMRQLHWGAAWLEVLIRRSDAAKARADNRRLKNVLDLGVCAVEHALFQEAAMALVTRTAINLACERVSLGFSSGRHVKAVAISHSADFGKQSNLVRAIEAAMDEAVDQNATVVFPPLEGTVPLADKFHAALARQHGPNAVCTVPMTVGGETLGGLTLERSADRPFSQETVELAETVAALVGPILESKRQEQRWLVKKVHEAFLLQLKHLLGPRHFIRKMVMLFMVSAAIFFSVFETDYRVTAPTVIEGAVQRVVAAPFDGYLKETSVRPGDVVKAGALLGLLDDRELTLERMKWVSERDKFFKQYYEAMAKHDQAQISILRSRIAQAEAQISLLDEELARCRITSPFDGFIVSGDLTQSLGAPVARGDVLFEVAPLDQYRVIIKVDEQDIGAVRVGQQSDLMLPSMPGDLFPFLIKKITPVTNAEEGRNYFRVEGALTTPTMSLRPGMEGVGKIRIGQRKLIWIWTHQAVNWVRLTLWKWMP